MEISTAKLGLAAYIQIKGGTFLGYRDRKFWYDSERSEDDWQTEYINSESHQHDMTLMNLRKLMKN